MSLVQLSTNVSGASVGRLPRWQRKETSVSTNNQGQHETKHTAAIVAHLQSFPFPIFPTGPGTLFQAKSNILSVLHADLQQAIIEGKYRCCTRSVNFGVAGIDPDLDEGPE